YKGGARIFEITFDPSDPDTVNKTCGVISGIKQELGDEVLAGAGTAIYPEYIKAAYEAGGEFAFSPNTDPGLIKLTKSLGMVSIPGAFTPSECMTALNAGADFVKLFPITVNDIGYLKNIVSPLSQMKFICTGGVNPDTIKAFFDAGAIGVGTGASVFRKDLVDTKNYAEITALTKEHIEIVRKCKAEGGSK
ncbi:MAG: bifunctional 4-hydroxy-2-oxoglutarate aldolase/2-dehydro-3-deoxy-phosphogluconate aldolase, partial [Acutalibacteraceae bacterium]